MKNLSQEYENDNVCNPMTLLKRQGCLLVILVYTRGES